MRGLTDMGRHERGQRLAPEAPIEMLPVLILSLRVRGDIVGIR